MKNLGLAFLAFAAIYGRPGHAPAQVPGIKSQKARWARKLAASVSAVDARSPGQLGLYVKDLGSGEEFSLRGGETWYLASGVKVPIAIEVFRRIDLGELSLETLVPLRESDYVDGAGETNQRPAGSLLSVWFLLEQMLIHSDNTASDLLIGLVGLEPINRTLRELVPTGFTPITRLADVRRHAYSGIHPAAYRLRNQDLMQLKRISDEREKVAAFARLLRLEGSQLKSHDLDLAYSAYYARQINSGTLVAYGRLLEAILEKRLLSARSTEQLLNLMGRAETGKDRIRAGFPAGFAFAHKTGTQHRRVCDFGIAWDPSDPSRRVLIAACAKGYKALPEAEAALKRLGKAIYQSGVFVASR